MNIVKRGISIFCYLLFFFVTAYAQNQPADPEDIAVPVVINQVNPGGVQIGTVHQWLDPDFSAVNLGKPVNLALGRDHIFRGEQNVINGYKYKQWYQNSVVQSDVLNHHSFYGTYQLSSLTSFLSDIYTASLIVNLDNVELPTGNVQFKDPWLIDFPDPVTNYSLRNRGMAGAEFKNISSGQGNLGVSSPYKGVFLNLPIETGKPYYKLKANANENFSGQVAYFQNWWLEGASLSNWSSGEEQPVVFNSNNAMVTANYKGHLRSNSAGSPIATNQRRVVKDGNTWLMVYESMNKIWMTLSTDNGVTWSKDENIGPGSGSFTYGYGINPTLSNVVKNSPSDPARVVVGWTEVDATDPAANGFLVFATITLNLTANGNIQKGWAPVSYSGPAINIPSFIRKVQMQAPTPTPYGSKDTRVSVIAKPSGEITFAYNISPNFQYWANGLALGHLNASTSSDIRDCILGLPSDIASGKTTSYPVLIYYPAAYGQPELEKLYYISTGYASGTRIVEYNLKTSTSALLPLPLNDYSYLSLSGAVNATSASYTLTANAINNYLVNTNIYQKGTYLGNSQPTLDKVYTNAENSVLMVQNTSNYGAPIYEVNFKQGTSWYKATGGASITQIGSNVGGIFAREQVGANDRKSVFVKTNTSPASLVVYSGSGVLNKGESVLYADVRSVRNYVTLSGQSKTAILDFAGALVEPVDSLENGSSLCAVKLIAPDQNTIIVRQPDSIKTALAIDLIRNGVSVRSYSASLWDELSINSFEDVQDGDVLVLRLGFPVASSWGYEIYDFNGTSLTKNEEETADAVKLKKLENGVSVYPNPFNPNTSISVSLEAPASVKVMVFNILGQLVSDFGKADLGAGVHTYAFDGKTLASGTYFYRVEIGEKVKTGKLQLLK
ncbi:MAG: T9SS type A sorting domain-containing protein [Bacteroidetes bacterium]|nr:T9SS type A sorting domain-containing protein [Bacteroidota bacterium]